MDFIERYLKNLAQKLIFEFDSAALVDHPTLKGDARETQVRLQLENILPGSTKVGSGIIFDTFGNKSRQQDLILYEGNHCPVFSVNNTPSASYFPIEGVIATGEVKSIFSKNTLEIALNNIKTVKSLKRYLKPGLNSDKESYHYRKINTALSILGAEDEKYDQANKGTDQLYSFIICHKFSNSAESTFNNFKEFYQKTEKSLQPNLILSLNDGCLFPVKKEGQNLRVCHSPMEADAMLYEEVGTKGFHRLISALFSIGTKNRSVTLDYISKYLSIDGNCPNKSFEI